MGIVFIMFAELWVTFFQTCAELWVLCCNQNGKSSSKIRLSNPPPPPPSHINTSKLSLPGLFIGVTFRETALFSMPAIARYGGSERKQIREEANTGFPSESSIFLTAIFSNLRR